MLKTTVRALLLASSLAVAAGTTSRAAELATPARVVTHHHTSIGGRTVDYDAVGEPIVIETADGQPEASLYSFSYLRTDAPAAADRPVIFLFNGGPGCSSVYLHMSGLGPRRVVTGAGPDQPAQPPFKVEDSAFSVLDVADLVFVDPVTTGFSRPLGAAKPEDFFGVTEDARAMSQFVERWLSLHGRWNSPKYLLGESYGTVRAAVMTKELMGSVTTGQFHGVALNGVILIGQAMDMSQTADNADNDLSYQLDLPTMAAVAWYHHRAGAGRTLDEVLADARAFAGGDYARALEAGDGLAPAEGQRLAARLSELIGLPAPFIAANNLRVSSAVFRDALLKDQGLVVSSTDGRFTAPAKTVAGPTVVVDIAAVKFDTAVIAALNQDMRAGLGVSPEAAYLPVNFEADFKWKWGSDPFYLNVAPYLGEAMRENPGFRAMFAMGEYDLTTPMAAAERVITHSGLAPGRVTRRYYAAGHMAYMGDAQARALADDVRAFVKSSPP
ncbi:MAG: hypothetical protein P4L73_09385 [Caulobacteraceae bacterium]|nr:hypothetical protein [Caulobacteraceae bacterium]